MAEGLTDDEKYQQGWHDALEKQGEQEKPQVYKTDDGEVITYSKSEGYKVIEPKFKVGDWITNGDYTWKIVEIKPLDYILQSQDGNIVDDTISHVDEQFHSFTIQDAKEGDVLVDEDINVIGIFEGTEGMCWHSKIYYSYATKELYGIECGGSHQKEFAKPATKEQRDTLMKAMADAGYAFDFAKKELKKIEQKSAEWSEEDEEMVDNILTPLAK
jgi:hypothetical protein